VKKLQQGGKIQEECKDVTVIKVWLYCTCMNCSTGQIRTAQLHWIKPNTPVCHVLFCFYYDLVLICLDEMDNETFW
jgi:hypothetical protein